MIVSFKHILHIVLVFHLFEQVNADLANEICLLSEARCLEVFCEKDVFRTKMFFLIKLQACNFTKKETLAQVFSYEFFKISKITFFQNTSGSCFYNVLILENCVHCFL